MEIQIKLSTVLQFANNIVNAHLELTAKEHVLLQMTGDKIVLCAASKGFFKEKNLMLADKKPKYAPGLSSSERQYLCPTVCTTRLHSLNKWLSAQHGNKCCNHL